MGATEVRLKVREKLERGVLPREKCQVTWFGRGRGLTCEACDEPVTPAQIECECELRSAQQREPTGIECRHARVVLAGEWCAGKREPARRLFCIASVDRLRLRVAGRHQHEDGRRRDLREPNT